MARRRYRRKGHRRVHHRRVHHRGTKWAVKCGSRVKSKHRKKSAAKRARPEGCRVIKHK